MKRTIFWAMVITLLIFVLGYFFSKPFTELRFSIIFIISCIFAFTVAGIAIYYYVYKRKLNQALQGNSGKGRKMPALPQVTQGIMAVCAVGSIIFMACEINSLNQEISYMREEVFGLNNSIQSMYGQFSSLLEEQNSLISSLDWDYGEYDFDTHEANIRVNVVPKQSSEDLLLVISVGDRKAALKPSGSGTYSGAIKLDIFSEYETPILSFTQGGVTQNEMLDEMYMNNLWDFYLPYASLAGNTIDCEERDKDGNVFTRQIFNIEFHPSRALDDYFLNEAWLVTVVNGQVTERQDVQNIASVDFANGFTLELEKELTYGEADVVEIYLEAVDNRGITYESSIFKWEDGAYYAFLGIPSVIDENGNVLLEGDILVEK